MATIFPSLEEILIAAGIAVDAARAKAAELGRRFPDGIVPQAEIDAWLTEYFSEDSVFAALAEAGRAWAKVAATGKGPVGHTGAELA